MSLFDDLSNAKPQSRGLKITEPEVGSDRNFVVSIDAIKLQESNNDLGTLFVVEFTILQGTPELNPPGAVRSWVQFPSTRPKTDKGNVKLFVAACMGITGGDPVVPAEAFQRAAEGGLDGTVLRLNVSHIITKGTKRDFFPHTWSPFTGDVEALRKSAPEAPAPEAPAVPPAPSAALTREAWLAGEGNGTTHPTNPTFEWNPDHADWGVRPKG